jgi:hypothetical protein
VFRRAGAVFDPAPHIWRYEVAELVRIAEDFSALPLSR